MNIRTLLLGVMLIFGASKAGLVVLAQSSPNPSDATTSQSPAEAETKADAEAEAKTKATTKAKPAKKNDKIELSFSDLDLKTMVQLISQATGIAFLYEDNLAKNKKITLLSTESYSIKDAYRIFENILDINGYTTIKEGPYVRIIGKNEARKSQSPLVKSTTGTITQGDFITMAIPIKNTDVNNIRGAITPFLSPSTLINQYIPANLLIIRDSRGIVAKIRQLIFLLDQRHSNLQVGRYPIINSDINQVLAILRNIFVKGAARKNVFFHIDNNDYTLIVLAAAAVQDKVQYYLKSLDTLPTNDFEFYILEYITAKDALKMAANIFPQGAPGKPNRSPVSITEDARTNRLLLVGPKLEIVRVKNFLAEIDLPLSETSSNYKVFYLNNSTAGEIAKTLQQVTGSVMRIAASTPTTAANTGKAAPKPVTTPNPNSKISIVGDPQTNSVVVFASASELALIDKLIADLDTARPQVFLEVMIMEVSLDKSLNLGINWKAAGGVGEALVGAGLGGSANFFPTTTTTLLNEGAAANVGVLGPSLIYNGQTYSSYSAFIQATRNDSDFNLISNPQILTVSNQESSISVGEVRPFQTATRVDVNNNLTTSYEYKEVGVSLKFTARIGEGNNIALKIDQSTKNVKESAGHLLTPTTIERTVSTNILANNQEIIVLGGLISENYGLSTKKTFCLGDIPILGWLFKASASSNSKTNLLIYIKPTIVRDVADREFLKQNASYYYHNTQKSGASDTIYDKLEMSEEDYQKKPRRLNLNKVEELPKVLAATKQDLTDQEHKTAPGDEKSSPELNAPDK